MPLVTFDIHTGLAPEQVLAMLTDFSARRPALWPTLARELYEVYEVHPTSADVKEGSSWPTRMWERVHYDWSAPGRVRWTIQESNYCARGSYVEVTLQDETNEGSHVQVEWKRTALGLKGEVLIALVVLTHGANIRRKVFERAFDRAARSSAYCDIAGLVEPSDAIPTSRRR